jgi:hypothetical protein
MPQKKSTVEPRTTKKSLWPLLAILVAIGLLTWLLSKVVNEPFLETLQRVGLIGVRVAVVAFTVLAGTFMYFFRCRWPYSYGFLEILIGGLAAVYVAAQLIETVNGKGMLVFAWIAGLYVIVRGWDNIHKAQSGSEKETWDRFWFGKKTDAKP